MVIMALLGDIMVINLGIDLIRPFPDLIMRYILAPKAKTQQHMNELFAIPADITLAFRIQLMNKMVVVGLMFSFALYPPRESNPQSPDPLRCMTMLGFDQEIVRLARTGGSPR